MDCDGDPIGEASEFAALLWNLAEQADAAGASLVLYKVDAAHLAWYVDLGMSAFKLGDEARVKLAEFTLAGSKNLICATTTTNVSKRVWSLGC